MAQCRYYKWHEVLRSECPRPCFFGKARQNRRVRSRKPACMGARKRLILRGSGRAISAFDRDVILDFSSLGGGRHVPQCRRSRLIYATEAPRAPPTRQRLPVW